MAGGPFQIGPRLQASGVARRLVESANTHGGFAAYAWRVFRLFLRVRSDVRRAKEPYTDEAIRELFAPAARRPSRLFRSRTWPWLVSHGRVESALTRVEGGDSAAAGAVFAAGNRSM